MGKVLDRAGLATESKILRDGKKTLVFTNGVFDLLHVGHMKSLETARDCADVLVVGINSDASTRKLKGPGRPILTESERAHLLASLSCVDYVTVFGESTPRKTIQALKPDVLAMSKE